MTDVLLRECVDEMRDKLHAGKYFEVLALGKHILHYYPKHIETYTLLGQASLEINDVPGATDVYRRVLSADPENVLALAGMALLAESQDKLDDALWYLERAYEIQPSNDELRRELVRVREAYYGTTASRLELTAGALARVYARQGQYAQAVNEYRRLLRNDNHRYDARVALTETLYRAGRNDEAAQLAQQVMADAPYSLKPNLILGALWSENAVPEGERFLERAAALDPENRVARDLLGERFAAPAPPSLPALGESEVPALEDSETTLANEEAARIAEVMQEIEREHDAESGYAAAVVFMDEALMAEHAANEAALSATAETGNAEMDQGISPKVIAAAGALSAVAAEKEKKQEPKLEEDETVATESAATTSAETTPADTATPAAARPAVTEVKPKGVGRPVSTDAIAAAAAALAASIVLDKNNQPSPDARANPAIPKVRPVIRSAQENLPSWLRLGATPAAASALFDAPTDEADQIAPFTAAAVSAGAVESAKRDDRPEWLVQAQAAQQATEAETSTDLTDWLGTPQAGTAPANETATDFSAGVDETPTTPAPVELPSWLQDSRSDATSEEGGVDAGKVAAVAAVAAMPNWLSDQEVTEAKATPTAGATVTTDPARTDATAAEAAIGASAVHEAVTEVPTVARVEPVAATRNEESMNAETTPTSAEEAETPSAQALPDPATMLSMAREKRANGDLKGALDLYERLMHRRPNHLDDVIEDLSEINQAAGASSASHRLLGEAFAMAGRFKESLEQYRIAMGK